MQVLLDATATSMMGIVPPPPPVWDQSSPEQIPDPIQQFPSSTSLCGIAGCPHHQVMVLPRHPDDDRKDDLHTVDPIRGEIIQPHVHHTPNPCNMTTAETMTSPVMTSGTTIANHYGLHHNATAFPPHHPHYPHQRTFVQHHIGKRTVISICTDVGFNYLYIYIYTFYISSLVGGSSLMDEDQHIDLEERTNGNNGTTTTKEPSLSIANKSLWNCCPMCARNQNASRHGHQGMIVK